MGGRDRRKKILTAVALVSFFFVAATSVRTAQNIDFRAFYCGGEAVNAGLDPYRVEPLRVCERGGSVHDPPLPSGSVVPVPLPEYDLAVFALFARLPYPQAVALWQTSLWAAVGITIFAVQRLTGASFAIITAALLFSDGFLCSSLGQLAPFSLAGLALSARYASLGRHAATALALSLAMCEPHVGASALIASALLIPSLRSKVPLAVLPPALLTFLATKGAWTTEYFHDVLPRHIVSEITHNGQYSLTMLCVLLGVPQKAAITLGGLSSLAALIIGILTAEQLRKKTHENAFVVLIPASFTLVGGTFLHLAQMPAALPAAFLLHARFPLLREMLGTAIILLAIPWTAFLELQILLPCVVLNLGFLAWTFINNKRAAAGTLIGGISLLITAAATFHFNVPKTHIVVSPTAFSEDAWRMAVEAVLSQQAAFFFPLKIPTWYALFIIAFSAIKASASAVTAEEPPYHKNHAT